MSASDPGSWAVGAAALSYGFRHKFPQLKTRNSPHARLRRLVPVATLQSGQALRLSQWQPGTGAFLALKAKQEVLLATSLLFEALVRHLKVALQQLRAQQRRFTQAAGQSASSLTHGLPWSSSGRREGFL